MDTKFKPLTRKALIDMTMSDKGFLPGIGYERFITSDYDRSTGLTVDYYLENIGGYVRRRLFKYWA